MSVAKLQKRLKQESTIVNPVQDIYQMIKEVTLKKGDRTPEEELRPTRANLAGLAVRIKHNLSGKKGSDDYSPEKTHDL